MYDTKLLPTISKNNGMSTKLQKSDKAPDFKLESEKGTKTLNDYAGKWLVLYFYPKDFTSGCTTEACDFRDLSPQMDASILGVSPDSVESHEKFKQEHKLNFLLLADEDNSVAKAYGAYGTKKMYGKTYEGIIRSTFLINPSGNIAEAMYNVRSSGHAAKVAERLEQLQAND